jgi:hypothetical protein
MGSCDATLAHYGTKMGLLEGLPGQHEHELRWANMSTSAVAAASLVAVPGGHGGLSGKQRGSLADAGGTYAHADGWKSCDKVKLDMFTGHKLQTPILYPVLPPAAIDKIRAQDGCL